jgi:hypothetical protein
VRWLTRQWRRGDNEPINGKTEKRRNPKETEKRRNGEIRKKRTNGENQNRDNGRTADYEDDYDDEHD